MSVVLIWTDYEACEMFATVGDAKRFCLDTYGPDRSQWPEFDEREPRVVGSVVTKQYYAAAWWPSWHYTAPPQKPSVQVAYGTQPILESDVGTIFRAKAATHDGAAGLAVADAIAAIPSYVGAGSSATSSGVLKIFRREDYKGRVGI